MRQKLLTRNKLFAVILVTIIVTAGLTAITIIVTSPSSAYTNEGKNYPGAPYYTVFKDGSNYFAKDTLGNIEYSGSNATDVANAVFDTGIEGVIKFIGSFELDGALLPLDGQTLDLYDLSLIHI